MELIKENPDIISVYREIYDNGDKLRGYLCRNLTSGEFVIYYYENPLARTGLTKYEIGKYNGNFDMLYYNTLSKVLTKEQPPKELLDLARPIWKKHIEYSEKHSYPHADEQEFNLIYFNYYNDFSLFVELLGQYRPDLKILNLAISETKWSRLSDEEKKKWINILIHELGHAKTNHKITLDKENQTISFQISGKFYEYKNVPLVFQPLSDGNLWLNDTIKSLGEVDLINLCLEEMANELECMETFPNYIPGYKIYAEIAPRLNSLTNGALIKTRYEGGELAFKKELLKLINDKSLYEQLFMEINSYLNFSLDKTKENINKIINEYEQAKLANGKVK